MSDSNLKPVTIKVPAKVNLFLHVLGKTDNNYHTLQSLIAFTDLTDTIEITPADNFEFRVTSKHSDIENDQNLVVQAAKKLSSLTGKKLNLKIHLEKNIPIGAGLGGGSADAAATIKGLLKYWGLKEPDTTHKLLVSLGADVPVCYEDNARYIEGYGEIIHPLDNMPSCSGIIVYPNILCSTGEIFQTYSTKCSKEISLMKEFENLEDLYSFLQDQRNDLTETACGLHPQIQNVLDDISRQEGCEISRMSGSGSSCFGLFKTKQQSTKAAEIIQKERPDWFVRPVTLY